VPICCPAPGKGFLAAALFLGVLVSRCIAGPILGFQGRLQVSGTNFQGNAGFRFALVPAAGGDPVWLSSPDADNNGIPDDPVPLTLERGVFALSLGDDTLPGMTGIPLESLGSGPLAVRVWFQPGTNPPTRLLPDQPLSTVGTALRANSVEDDRVGFSALQRPVLSRFAEMDAATSGLSNLVEAHGLTLLLVQDRLTRLDAETVVLSNRVETLGGTLGTVQGRLTQLDAAAAGLSNRVDTHDGSLVSAQDHLARLDATALNLTAALASLSNAVAASAPPAGSVVASLSASDPNLTGAGYERFHGFPSPSWESIPATAESPLARTDHVTAWVGGDVVVWGGLLANGSATASGAAYRPSSSSWRTLSPLGAPSARAAAGFAASTNALWVWGGFASGTFLQSGGAWTSDTGSWSAVPTAGAPSGRDGHSVAWTGSRLLVWGGRNDAGLLDDGSHWNPSNGTWSALPTDGAPSARMNAIAVLCGRRWVVWGGIGPGGVLGDGARLEIDSSGIPTGWTTLSSTGAPSARSGACAVWTGTRLIVWGGEADAPLATGAAYDPSADTWTALPSTLAPSARTRAASVWTGQEMVVFGGLGVAGVLADGGAYHPADAKWRPLSNPGSPAGRYSSGAVWTGARLFLFGGEGSSGSIAAPFQVDPSPTWHLYRKP
jgi:hypothetical protein